MNLKQTALASLFLSALAFWSGAARGQVKLAAVFTDHMVVQRGRALNVWGSAEPGEKGTVSFRGSSVSFQADDIGRWRTALQAGDAGGPFQLVVQAKQHLEISDILVGDVWLASGQSNMQFTMGNAHLNNGPAEVAQATDHSIRLLLVKMVTSDHPLPDIETAGWKVCSPDAVKNFSAVAYFFGRELRQHQNVPIGLIDASWGGTPAEAWTSLDALTSDAALMPVLSTGAALIDSVAANQRKLALRRSLGSTPAATNPTVKDTYPTSPESWNPGWIFNGMVAPLTPMPLRGVIWYQGESNAGTPRAAIYERLFQTLIKDWRHHWGEEHLPFLFVQLANYNAMGDMATVREAQRKALQLSDTGMAVTIDIGEADNVHPGNKQDVGRRLALIARQQVYGEALEQSGPVPVALDVISGRGIVHFTHADGMSAHGGKLTGFEVAGEDGVFVAAEANVTGNLVTVQSARVMAPVTVRYGWGNTPKCNLFNGAGLPAAPFTITEPGATYDR